MYEIIIGRSDADKKKFGLRGAIYLGKQYVKMGATTSISHKIYLDVASSHVVFVCGKRGQGKSYTLGVIAEGLAELEPDVRENLSFILLDTMGIYWTMKYPNHQEESLLRDWGLEGKGLPVVIYTPSGFLETQKKAGIPVDKSFSIKPSELAPEDWWITFELNPNDPLGVFVERIIL